MFRNAAKQIAHNSTLPSLQLGGNKDLKPLQDLITAEKSVLVSLQKLSVDLTRASELLRSWGAGEGEDLGDILGASATVLGHYSASLAAYASKEHAIRDQLKAIRTREEALDELKRRRKTALSKADAAEKKLNKMGPEHKNLPAQTDALAQLQAQIRQMDGEIMNEEAALGDFKRTSARALMGLKFGGLMEVSEKGCIVAEMGRAIAAEISEDVTQPGMPRSMYMAHQQTSQRVMETERTVNEITFSGALASSGVPSQPRLAPTNFAHSDGVGAQNTGVSSFNPYASNGLDSISAQNTGMYDAPPGPPGAASGFLPPPDTNSFLDGRASPGSAFTYQPPQTQGPPSPSASSFVPPQTGGYTASTLSSVYSPPSQSEYTSPGAYSATSGGYSATAGGTGGYPSAPGGTEGLPEPSHDDAAGLSSTGVGPGAQGPGGGRFATFPVRGRGLSSSGGSQIQSAGSDAPTPSLGAMTRKDTSGSDFMASVLDASEFGFIAQYSNEPDTQKPPPTHVTNSSISSKNQEHLPSPHDDDPVPEYRDYEPSQYSSYSSPGATSAGGTTSSYPPGPPPGAAAPVVGGVWVGELTPRPIPSLTVEEGGGDRTSTATSEEFSLAYMNNDDEGLLPGENEQQRQQRLSRHVRFGGEGVFGETIPPFQRQDSSPAPSARSRRVPPPAFEAEKDERALNAAAAREISREMDSLSFSPPAPSPARIQSPPTEPGWEMATTSPNPPSPEQIPSPQPGAKYGSPPKEQRMSPPAQYAQPPPPNRSYTASPPQSYAPPSAQYQPPPSEYQPPARREPSPLNTSLPSHQTSPSSDFGTTGNKPFAPGHHTTPSWAMSPVLGSSEGGMSPRLEAPYRPFANRSTSSVNSQTQPPPGAKTISAAAFRRPQKAFGDSGAGVAIADTSPLAPKKRLPASPYPQRGGGGSSISQAAPTPPPATEDAFDYISAYERDSKAFFSDDMGNGSPARANHEQGAGYDIR
ncbi:hypothetical protein MKEN_01227500 [Mycena kentingensis (nom. inval.)]|nr:hypothetical protein MKEN_01227500 [Mycena kentingensis (nom. inval.)]